MITDARTGLDPAPPDAGKGGPFLLPPPARGGPGPPLPAAGQPLFPESADQPLHQQVGLYLAVNPGTQGVDRGRTLAPAPPRQYPLRGNLQAQGAEGAVKGEQPAQENPPANTAEGAEEGSLLEEGSQEHH